MLFFKMFLLARFLLVLTCMTCVARCEILHNEAFFHVIWKCHDSSWFLGSSEEKDFYYGLLVKYIKRYKVDIFAYCIMSNHVHLVGFTKEIYELSDFMRAVNTQFARWINKRRKRRGQVILDRFKSPVIETSQDLLRVMRYCDLNPVRAGIFSDPRDYKWSSYEYYAHGREDKLLTPSPSYMELANTPEERQDIYCGMVAELVEEGLVKNTYSSVCYIGNPNWVTKKYASLRKTTKEKRLAYLIRRKERFSVTDPP